MTEFLLVLPVLLFSVVAHEYAHAWTAFRQGDPTAYMLGRLTLNPLPHIDPFYSVLVPVGLWFLSHGAFTFGAARPVPVNPRNYRNYRRGDVIVSSAGIVTNLLLAVCCAILFVVLGIAGGALTEFAGVGGTLQRMLLFGVFFNYILAVFNLVPIPPLDGSHIFYHLLPADWGARYRRLYQYGFAVLFATMLIPGLSVVWDVLLWPAQRLSQLTFAVIGGFALPGAVQ